MASGLFCFQGAYIKRGRAFPRSRRVPSTPQRAFRPVNDRPSFSTASPRQGSGGPDAAQDGGAGAIYKINNRIRHKENPSELKVGDRQAGAVASALSFAEAPISFVWVNLLTLKLRMIAGDCRVGVIAILESV